MVSLPFLFPIPSVLQTQSPRPFSIPMSGIRTLALCRLWIGPYLTSLLTSQGRGHRRVASRYTPAVLVPPTLTPSRSFPCTSLHLPPVRLPPVPAWYLTMLPSPAFPESPPLPSFGHLHQPPLTTSNHYQPSPPRSLRS